MRARNSLVRSILNDASFRSVFFVLLICVLLPDDNEPKLELLFRFSRRRLIVRWSHAFSVAALDYSVHPSDRADVYYLFLFSFYCCRAHALRLPILPVCTEPNAEPLLPDAPAAAPSAPVGEEFNSQKLSARVPCHFPTRALLSTRVSLPTSHA